MKKHKSFCGSEFDPKEKGPCLTSCRKDMNDQFLLCFSAYKKRKAKEDEKKAIETAVNGLVSLAKGKTVSEVAKKSERGKTAIPPEKKPIEKKAKENKPVEKHKKPDKKAVVKKRAYDEERHPEYGYHTGTRAFVSSTLMERKEGATWQEMIDATGATKSSLMNVISDLRKRCGVIVEKREDRWFIVKEKPKKKGEKK